MAPRLRSLGTIGAVLLAIGPAVVGIGYLNAGLALYNAVDCSPCNDRGAGALNASVEVPAFYGAGLIVGGVGAGLVLFVVGQFLVRKPPGGPAGNPRPNVSTLFPPSPPRGW